MIVDALGFAAVALAVVAVIGVVGFLAVRGLVWFMDLTLDRPYGGWIFFPVLGGFLFCILFGLALMHPVS